MFQGRNRTYPKNFVPICCNHRFLQIRYESLFKNEVMVEGVKRLTVTMLVSKPEARKTKLEYPVSITSLDTSFDNDKRGRLVPKGGFEPPQDVHPTRP